MAYTDIDKSDDYFNTVLYTGQEPSNKAVTVGFQPDWIWIKQRSGAEQHHIEDSVRGVENTIRSNSTDAEVDRGSNGIQSFDSNGFTAGGGDDINSNGGTFVSWNWLAGGTASSNTDGSITSSVSANNTAGFSILTRTGTGSNGTVGHGLGVAPKVIINKDINSGSSWWGVYHESLGNTNAIYLNTTNATDANVAYWNNTSPTSSVFSVGTNSISNASGGTYVSYCFAEKKGFSKFGSYTGNGNANGTFVYTGFKPSWFMTKRTDSANSWVMFDNKRSSSGGFNEIDYSVNANSNGAEETSNTSSDVDFCSNGIKITEDNGAINASGGTFIYMAFAENPFVTSTGIPGTAR